MVALPLKRNPGLYDMLLGKVSELHMIGDCREPGLMIDAIAAGFEVGQTV